MKVPLFSALACVSVAACGGTQAPAREPALTVDVRDPRLAAHPDFAAELAADAFQYFRFINVPFSDAVCDDFRDELPAMPTVNLHGDAHLEQYAVTPTGSGLVDFDDSSTGPAILDLVRFAASLRIAATERGEDGDAAVQRFFDGYRDALTDPDTVAPVPPFVEEVRAGFAPNRQAFLDTATALMSPVDDNVEGELLAAVEAYADGVRAASEATLSDHHFDVVAAGTIDVGSGSRLDQKFLVRLQAESLAPDDDVIVEFKEVRDLSGISCISSRTGGGAFRVLVGQARIGGDFDLYLAPVPRMPEGVFADTLFWGRAWYDDYHEFDVEQPYVNDENILAVAYGVGVQLGVGHIAHIASPLDAHLRREQLAQLERFRPRLTRLSEELADRTVQGWRDFAERVGD